MAAKINNSEHHICTIDNNKWLGFNLDAVWRSDGEICFLDTVGNEHLEFIGSRISVCLNGIAGDSIHGGGFSAMANQHFDDLSDPYGYRGRRYIRMGFRLDESYFKVRMPFYDNALIELTMSLPPQLKAGSYFYKQALLANFPDYFDKIPWQKTGSPISYPLYLQTALSIVKRMDSRFKKALKQCGFPILDTRNFVSMSQRINSEPGRSFLSDLFFNPDSVYPQYIDRDNVLKLWKSHQTGHDHSKLINRYATFEIWCRQFFKKELRGR
jgi:asparagine synthetase B (glutamine-hydrolysing)